MENNIKQRFILFLKHLGIGQTEFEKRCEISRGAISKIKDGVSSPNLKKIAEVYPELNLDWLITGNGEMLNYFLVPKNADKIRKVYKNCLEAGKKILESNSKPVFSNNNSVHNSKETDFKDVNFESVKFEEDENLTDEYYIKNVNELFILMRFDIKKFRQGIKSTFDFVKMHQFILDLPKKYIWLNENISDTKIENTKIVSIEQEYSDDDGIYLYDVSAAAGYGSFDVMISKDNIIGKYKIPDFKHADFLIYVTGSSMYPKYSSGDIIACKKLYESQFIQWGKVYVIATEEQGLLVKRLKKCENDNYITAVSDNPNYEPFDIPKVEICGLALVLGVLRLE